MISEKKKKTKHLACVITRRIYGVLLSLGDDIGKNQDSQVYDRPRIYGASLLGRRTT